MPRRPHFYVSTLSRANDRSHYGGKAANLAKMIQANLPVPDGFAVSIEAFTQTGTLRSEAKQQVKSLLKSDGLFAVRSSALAEDSLSASWAGQFETFLDTSSNDVIEKIESCHKSSKTRAAAYGGESQKPNSFRVAVVVQEMVNASYAGLAFTKDPSTGANQIDFEYVRGLGEPLVHGDVDPERVIWSRSRHCIKEQSEKKLPIPLRDLVSLAEKVEAIFAAIPQDIEWAYDGDQIWIVQARPITTLQERGVGKHYLGDPGNLFYWGPSRATPLYMSDFMQAAERFFARTIADESLPEAPKTLVLFHENKVAWLIKAKAFNSFVSSIFRVYERTHDILADKANWTKAVDKLDRYFAKNKVLDLKEVNRLLEAAWQPTLMPEFALYGAESVLHERLSRFDDISSQKIWGSMTLAENPMFMQRIDIELVAKGKPDQLATTYPWIEDGYYGVVAKPSIYFRKRLKTVRQNTLDQTGSEKKREAIIKQYGLKKNEVKALYLARELSIFMDERKAWMMRTRRYIQQAAQQATEKLKTTLGQVNGTTIDRLAAGKTAPYFGTTFLAGKAINLSQEDVRLAWDWYVEFRASHTVLKGFVASSAGQHFMNGEVFVAQTPQDAMPDNAVLVVPSTSPSYVPLMRSARALVTDHGGVMSHAAIVAREFGLPCIVGTKRATKILKNGDKIVLDLVKGEINK